MSIKRIATRYAKSLMDLSVDQNKMERIKEDVDSFREAIKVRDFKLLLKSPIIKGDKKWSIIQQLFEGKYDELTMAFLKILIQKGREGYLPEIADEFMFQYKHFKHISTISLTTATPLNQELIENIRKKLAASDVTDDNVEIITKIDPDLIGGFVIEFDDKLFDSSVKHKLESFKKEFKDNLYVSKISGT